MPLILSARTKSDLLSIAKYTQKEWGAAQARKYILQLNARCQALVVTPNIGRILNPEKPHQRYIREGSHFIFYRIDPIGIFIRRIIHQNMFPPNHDVV